MLKSMLVWKLFHNKCNDWTNFISNYLERLVFGLNIRMQNQTTEILIYLQKYILCLLLKSK